MKAWLARSSIPSIQIWPSTKRLPNSWLVRLPSNAPSAKSGCVLIQYHFHSIIIRAFARRSREALVVIIWLVSRIFSGRPGYAMLGRFQAVRGKGPLLPNFLLIGYQYTSSSNLGRCGHQLYVFISHLPSWNYCLMQASCRVVFSCWRCGATITHDEIYGSSNHLPACPLKRWFRSLFSWVSSHLPYTSQISCHDTSEGGLINAVNRVNLPGFI